MEYTKKITRVGGSLGTLIPADVLKYLELNEGDEVVIKPLNGKHGKYLAIWKSVSNEQV